MKYVIRLSKSDTDKVEATMSEYKKGTLKSHGKKVKSRKQAIAIGLSQQKHQDTGEW